MRERGRFHRLVLKNTIERRKLGTVPLVLRGGDKWLPPEAEQELAEEVDADLAERGLLGRDGSLLTGFEEDLLTIGHAEVAAYGWAGHIELGNYAFHVARHGGEAVLLDVQGDWVTMSRTNAGEFVNALIAQLPTHPFGTGRTYNFPESEAPWRLRDGRYTADGALASHDARQAAGVMSQPRCGDTQMHAAGRRGDAKRPLDFIDFVEHGRWTIRRDDSNPTNPYLTLLPVNMARLQESIGALLRAVS